MRLKHLLSVFFTLLTLGVGQMWGATVTLTPTDFTDWSGTQEAQSQTTQGFTISSTSGMNSSNAHLRLYSGATHTITSSVGNITEIVFTCTANGTNNYGPGKMSGSGYTASSGKTGTWSGNAATVTLSGGQARVTSIKITYTATASYTVTYNKNGGTGTMSNGTGASITLAECGFTAPDCKRFKEWNTAQGGGGTSYHPEDVVTSTMTLYAIWEDIPTYSVTLKDDNTVLTQPNCSTGVTLPSRSDCPTQDYTFAGWTKSWTSTQSSWTTTAPAIINAGSYTPTEDVNLYPVYTKTESGDAEEVEYSSNNINKNNLGSTGDKTWNGKTWNVAVTWSGTSFFGTSTTEAQIGSGNKPASSITISTSAFTSKVTHVKVRTRGASDVNATMSVSVNGVAYKCNNNTSVSLTNSYPQNGYDFVGSSTGGEIEISWIVNDTKKAIYIDKIDVITEESTSTTSYISVPNCCTPLGSINGSFS